MRKVSFVVANSDVAFADADFRRTRRTTHYCLPFYNNKSTSGLYYVYGEGGRYVVVAMIMMVMMLMDGWMVARRLR